LAQIIGQSIIGAPLLPTITLLSDASSRENRHSKYLHRPYTAVQLSSAQSAQSK